MIVKEKKTVNCDQIRMTSSLRPALAMLTVALFFTAALRVLAAEPEAASNAASAPITTVASLLTRDLTGVEGKEAIMITVEYAPGASSPPHQHDAHVFVYVLEGSIVMQVDGHDPVTLNPGDTFYESPTDVHRKSANASAIEPAKFLVMMVKDKGKPVSHPVDAESAQ